MRTFSERLAESAQTPLTPQEHIDRLQALLDATADQNRFSLKPKDGAYEGSYNLKTNSGSYPMEDVVAMFDPLVTTPETERMIPSQQALREQTQAMKNWRATLDALQNADYTLDIEAKEKELQEANAKQYRDAMRQAMSNFLSRYVEPEKAELYDSSVGTTFSSLKNPYENFGYRTPLDHLSTYAQKKIAADALPVLIGGPTRTESQPKSDELEELLLNLRRKTGVSGTNMSYQEPRPPPQDELQQILQYARDPTAPAREQFELNTANMYDVHPMHYDQFTQLVQGGMHPAMAAKQVSQGFDMSQPQFGDIQMSASPMDLAFRLLKERKSPEAMRHKLEYDKRYESSPERVKYREELNRERRRRGIMGSHDHMDVSHTQGNKLTLESEHDNRARHFKNRGTLRQIDKVE